MNKIGNLPWKLTFLWPRLAGGAAEGLERKGSECRCRIRLPAHRAKMNGLASLGQWSNDQEKKAA